MFTTWLEWLTNIYKLLQTDASGHEYKQFGKDANDFFEFCIFLFISRTKSNFVGCVGDEINHIRSAMAPKITRGKKEKDKAVVPYDSEPVQPESTTEKADDRWLE